MNKILEIQLGSHLYGTSTLESDMDFKGIYIPTAREIVLGTYQNTIATSRPKKLNERNTKGDVDIDIYSLDRFLELLTEGQTVALDMLFCNPNNNTEITDQGSEIMFHIDTNLEKLLTRNVNAFVGYAKQQAAKYGIKGSRMDALQHTVSLLNTLPQFFMRKRRDQRQDNIIKEVILDFEILTWYVPYFIIDDRQQVVEMWRSRGFTCLQCNKCDF